MGKGKTKNTANETKLSALASNLWWTWHNGGASFWSKLAPELWLSSDHNPSRMLAQLGGDAAGLLDKELSSELDSLYNAQTAYVDDANPWHAEVGSPLKGTVAYFSAEYGIHESFPIYSGGLGILAGDHVKSASDLGLPFVAMGLLYRNGYVRQEVDGDGIQLATYRNYDFDELVVEPVMSAGEQLSVEVPMRGETCVALVWLVRVGRAPLYLLDTDHDGNPEHMRGITARLYGGGAETRIKQELVLGVGGTRALAALGIEPKVFHLNEGHSSFLALERIRREMEAGRARTHEEAMANLRGSGVFTTHTPVEAGHDRFDPNLAWEHLSWLAEPLKIDRETLLNLGRWPEARNPNALFNMTLLAMRACEHLNGVAALHGEVSRSMFAPLWGDLPAAEVPISHVTNGVHAPSWQAHELHEVLMDVMPNGYRARPITDMVWQKVDSVSDERLWNAHLQLKERLFELVKNRESNRRARLGLPEATFKLDPAALTIGFARRFATYKRADLVFQEMDRLLGILEKAPGPVQLLFSGKAHPADKPGQALVKKVYEASQHPDLAGRVFLIEDYDIEVGRTMVQGVDVWLNNPRRPKEASGTSGMKVAMNGGLNFSILDGWWPEGYNGTNGWAIGDTRSYPNPGAQDHADRIDLYNQLENRVIPTYYARGLGNLSPEWMKMMKAAIASATPAFSSDRQVRDYVTHLYSRAL